MTHLYPRNRWCLFSCIYASTYKYELNLRFLCKMSSVLTQKLKVLILEPLSPLKPQSVFIIKALFFSDT